MKTQREARRDKAVDVEIAAADAITVLVLGIALVVGLAVACVSALLATF